MTVEELMKELAKMPKYKKVELGSFDVFFGEAVRVTEHENHIEIESNDTVM